MDKFDKGFTESIKRKLIMLLGRNLTKDEFSAFSIERSGIAYEMIMDYISEEEKSKKEIEDYVESESVTNESKKNYPYKS